MRATKHSTGTQDRQKTVTRTGRAVVFEEPSSIRRTVHNATRSNEMYYLDDSFAKAQIPPTKSSAESALYVNDRENNYHRTCIRIVKPTRIAHEFLSTKRVGWVDRDLIICY